MATDMNIRFMELRRDLRAELVKLGRTVDTYFNRIGGIDLNVSFQNDDEKTIRVFYGLRSERHQMVNPKASNLAFAIDKYIKDYETAFGMNNKPRPNVVPPSPKQPKEERRVFNMPASGVPENAPSEREANDGGMWVNKEIADKLRNGGVVMSREQFLALKSRKILTQTEFDELTYGFVPKPERDKILNIMDRLNKWLS